MKVTVSVLGRFHAFYLARELERRGSLDRLVTSYPRWGAARWGVPRDRVRSLWPVEALRRALPGPLVRRIKRRGWLHDAYDALAAGRVPRTSDLVTAWSGAAERTLRTAQDRGACGVLERGSAHIRTQREILREEYERHGLEADLPSDAAVEREEQEYELADNIAIPSIFVERTFLDRGVDGDKLLKVPYGVDLEEFRPVAKEDDVFRVVFAGALSVRKGIIYLLKAFTELGLPNSELLLLGTAREEARPWLARYGDGVRQPGHIPQEELYRWYSQGSVFVLPSIEDGFGMVLTQAMACGLPLICTPHTGGEDLIRKGKEGFVIPIRDVEALKERLEWCYENQDACRKMGRAARRRVQLNFTWTNYGDRIIDAYKSALAK